MVHAETCRHEREKFVFEKADADSLQFFVDAEIVGISETLPTLVPEAGLAQAADAAPLEELLANYERQIIARALEQCQYSLNRAADQLGISRHALRYRMHRLNLDGQPIRDDDS
jgi:DNA-binding NtrC family response regulator